MGEKKAAKRRTKKKEKRRVSLTRYWARIEGGREGEEKKYGFNGTWKD